jgi:Xaa-Pro aminopeptidase
MAPPPAPPPPPPPICFPFSRSKQKPRRLSYTNSFDDKPPRSPPAADGQLVRSGSYSPTATLTSHAENLTFVSDSEAYDAIPAPNTNRRPKLIRSNTITGAKHPSSSKWGYGWGVGKHVREKEAVEKPPSLHSVDKPASVQPPSRHNSKSSNNSKFSNVSNNSKATNDSKSTNKSANKSNHNRSDSQRSKRTLIPSDSTSTLVGSAYERKVNDVEVIREKVDTFERLEELRKLMAKDNLDY